MGDKKKKAQMFVKKKKKAQMFVKLVSAAGTGFFYVKRKPRQFVERTGGSLYKCALCGL